MHRPALWVIFFALILLCAAAGAALSMVPTNFVAYEPHAPLELNDKIKVDGRRTEPLHGRLYLVGVEKHELNLLQKWLLRLDPKVTVAPETGGAPPQEQLKSDQEAIKSSKEIAAAVSFRLLGENPRITGDGAIVTWVDPDGPSQGNLQSGDRIVKFNDQIVGTSIDVVERVSALPPNSTVKLGVRREGRPYVIKMRTASPVAGDRVHKSRIGVSVTTPNLDIQLPHTVDVSTENVVGPSAGLAFSLALFDSRSPIDLVRGRYIVATGTLTLEGNVAAVGGIKQKAIAAQDAGAEYMLVPMGNADEAVKTIKKFCQSGSRCTRVVPVSSVQDAVAVMQEPDLGTRAVS